MKSTLETIREMEKEYSRNVSSAKMDIYPSIRTLLEAFGEEVIGEDTYHTITDPDRIDAGKKAPHPYNDHRAEQRLKVKEIIKNIT